MRHVMKFGLLLSVILLLTACINIPIGDGNKLKISKDGLTFTDETGDETSFEIDKDAGQINVSGGKEGEEVEFALGQNVQVPDDFPKDIPFMSDANIFQAMKMVDGETTINVSYFTNESIEEIRNLYDNYVENAYTTVEKMDEAETPYANTEMVWYMITGESDFGKIIITSLANNEDTESVGDEEYAHLITVVYIPAEK